MGKLKNTGLRNKERNHYMALSLGGKSLADDLSENLTFSCTNMTVLSRNTEIPYHRLIYVFSKLRKTCLIENDYIVIRSSNHFKGKQPGGLRNLNFVRRSND